MSKFSEAFTALHDLAMSTNIENRVTSKHSQVAVYLGRFIMREHIEGFLQEELPGDRDTILRHIVCLDDAEWKRIYQILSIRADWGLEKFKDKRLDWLSELDTYRAFA